MRADAERAGIFGFRPVVIILASPVPKIPMAVGNRASFPPMVLGLQKSFDKLVLELVPIEEPELFSKKFLRRIRCKPFRQNRVSSSCRSICRDIHWYLVKNSKARATATKPVFFPVPQPT
jgi:hypothetical protein